MSYIGNEPIVSATRTVTESTATAGQTTFTANGGYTVGFIDVFVNGSQLQSSDFTATNGSTVVLTNACAVGDDVRLVAYGTFQTSSALTANNPSYTGTLTGGTGVVNIGSGQIYKDASGNVGIGTASPQMPLDLSGTVLSNVNATVPSVYGLRANLHNSFAMDGNNAVGDLNNVRSLGVRSYYTSAASSNAPSSYGSAFAYEHYVGASGVGSKYISQFAVAHNVTPSLYYRNSDTSNGSTFSNWYSVNLTSVSDIRAKKNIVDAPSQLDVLTQLEVKQFEYINENDAGTQIGMIAQQVDSIDPYYVTKDLENADVMWRVHYDKMVPMLVKSIQEQQAQIEELKAKVNVLENK